MRTVGSRITLVRCDIVRTCTMLLEIDKGELICIKRRQGKEFRMILKFLCKYK